MSNPLLEQFIAESRDCLQSVSEILIELEKEGEHKNLLNELFRLVHTLKGNSGLFDFPSMTKLLHSAEDLMNSIREDKIDYSSEIADVLLEAMDIVLSMIDGIEASGSFSANLAQLAQTKANDIKEKFLKFTDKNDQISTKKPEEETQKQPNDEKNILEQIFDFSIIKEEFLMEALKGALNGKQVIAINYSPENECFYKGEDPLYLVRKTPGLIWSRAYLREEISDPASMDIYKCITDFDLLSFANKDELAEHFKYVLDQVKFDDVNLTALIIPYGDKNGGPVYEDFVSDARRYLEENNVETLKNAVASLLELSSPSLYFASILRWIGLFIDYLPQYKHIVEALLKSLETMEPPVFSIQREDVGENKKTEPKKSTQEPKLTDEFLKIIKVQKIVLEKLSSIEAKLTRSNILNGVIASIENGLISLGEKETVEELKNIAQKVSPENFGLLDNWITERFGTYLLENKTEPTVDKAYEQSTSSEAPPASQERPAEKEAALAHSINKILKVDESKIDRLMNLIGEFVVAKNSLPYIANKAESVYGILELSKEIKGQHSVLNRIAEEMQDAIMQIRMIPVSTVFQRFPRLVRDLSKKLNKKIELKLEGEETEADKNVIESLSDPLIHIIRNSIDHGIESPQERTSKGKPEEGTITLSAKHESDHVLIEVIDDGRGIDPHKVKLKAYQKGLITEEQFEKMKDNEAVNLIFLPGFSTAEVATDLSGRGVGMDVVRTAVEKFGGFVKIQTELDKGSTISLSLPLSMAVSHVMIIESGGERLGIPIDTIVETVRISQETIQKIKGKMVAILRNKVVPIFYLNELLEIDKPHITNEEGEYAIAVLSVKGELIGIVVDGFYETADIILKPLSGFLASMRTFSGIAIMGDGSVLLVINPKELVNVNRI